MLRVCLTSTILATHNINIDISDKFVKKMAIPLHHPENLVTKIADFYGCGPLDRINFTVDTSVEIFSLFLSSPVFPDFST